MKQKTSFDNLLFAWFYDHVTRNQEEPYLTYKGTTLSYGDAFNIIRKVIHIILTNTAAHGHPSVALYFQDQQKLLLSFWACMALEVDVILVPERPVALEGLRYKDQKLEIDLVLSDLLQGSNCYDIDTRPENSPASLQLDSPARSGSKNIYFFTSGTTGKAQLVRTTGHQWLRAITCLRENSLMPYTVGQKALITVPLFHSYGLSAAVEYTVGGSHIFLPGHRESIGPVQCLFDKSIGHQITAIEGVPYFYQQMSLFLNRLSLPALKHIGMGGDCVTDKLISKFEQKIASPTFSIRYGITEIPSAVSIHYFDYNPGICLRSLGKILPIYQVKLLNEKQGTGETSGEMLVGCQYLPDQFIDIHTHDIIEMIQGEIKFEGRKIFIKYKGYKINPQEIEYHLNNLNNVFESKVHLSNGVLRAEIVPVANTIPELKVLRTSLAQKLPKEFLPERIELVESIQRNTVGKIIR
ncbi:class I adenylate-forming enzyme family protein [Fulvivirgaceae bacterium BMA12]|uniref:Class I adenylate-forming enzyme family protein n=1 Tax=Agaribacillus aureus TaxID=3051825 RepID=A0ABT8LD37_9BACT|nr:class I adenylate-forming enzyme family protein [Fulvivirgaceae bacterium BMA12]